MNRKKSLWYILRTASVFKTVHVYQGLRVKKSLKWIYKKYSKEGLFWGENKEVPLQLINPIKKLITLSQDH